jgi:hypothetical protein
MLYLCDDGKDPEKQAWLTQNYGDGRLGEVHYITGRSGAIVSSWSTLCAAVRDFLHVSLRLGIFACLAVAAAAVDWWLTAGCCWHQLQMCFAVLAVVVNAHHQVAC